MATTHMRSNRVRMHLCSGMEWAVGKGIVAMSAHCKDITALVVYTVSFVFP